MRAALMSLVALAVAASCRGDDAAAELRAARAEEGVRALITELVNDPASLYDQASPAFRSDRERGSFIGQAHDLAVVLGAFEGDVAITSINLYEGARGRTARLSARLGFERAAIEGSVSFEEHEGSWRLLGLDLPIPEPLEEAWIAAAAARGIADAPEEAIEAAYAILEALGAGRATSASDEASEAAARAIEEFGAYKDMVRISWSRIDIDGERARISSILEFEQGWMRAELELVAAPTGDLGWELRSLRVVDPNARDAPSAS